MVLLNVTLLSGRTEDQKAQGLQMLTSAISHALDLERDKICVVVEDVPKAHFSSGARAASTN
ncbi:MAG: hypothetical protein CVT83_00250 [Alphaproteobacteria bacterium HGW-Alphaproteobacteria-5]|jgi:4-oxalocrotonate tautomerase family enzyme|nr:MAG: hypothetical protein CVT83_00250 [Alphaproteobacteria bacterium HGW-Alphaproteobacteria-5]